MPRSIIIESDGGARGNPGPAAYGTVVRDGATGALIAELAEYLGTTTNNVAEYRGVVAGLEYVRSVDPDAVVEVRVDSRLVAEQLSGGWKIKHPNMRELALRARAALPPGQVTYVWVPREANAEADALVNEMLDAAASGRTEAILRTADMPAAVQQADDVVGSAQEVHARTVIDTKLRPANKMIGWADLGPPTTTLLARHGASTFSLEKRFSGAGGVDVPLAPIGEAQAMVLAKELAARGGIDAIVSSPLLRAQQTAVIVGAELGLPLEIDEGIAECAFGEWDGLTLPEVEQRWPVLLEEWLASTQVAPPGGESLAACRDRVDRARERIVGAHQGRTVLLVSHVNPIKILVSLAIDAHLRSLFRMELPPCSVSTLAWFPDGNSSMFGFAEAAHLRAVPAPYGT